MLCQLAVFIRDCKTPLVTSHDHVETIRLVRAPGVERIDLLRFLAGCRKRRLNQALSVLSLSPKIFRVRLLCC